MTASATNGTATNGTATNGTSNGTSNGTVTTAPVPRTKICVFCGSSSGNKPEYVEAARSLAKAMAANDIDLVYGGGTVGLMGEVAKTLCSLKGPDAVHGIIPEALVRYERDDTYATVNADGRCVPDQSRYGRTTVVADMHTRKKLMAEEVFAGGPGSGFVALPGGFGTMEELLEVVTWNQLGIHERGVCVLNVAGYWQGLLDLVANAVAQGFLHPDNQRIVVAAATPREAIDLLRNYKVSAAAFNLEWGKQ